MSETLAIDGRVIGSGQRPFVIAELSANHNGDLDRALRIVDAAADCGADALKVQTYTAGSLTIDSDRPEFVIADPGSPWEGENLYRLYEEAAMPMEWHGPIFDRCRERGLIGFSSAFDPGGVDFLERLGVGLHKIASPEIVDIPLIRAMAATGKPLLVSCGMATEEEVAEAVAAAKGAGCDQLLLLKCTSTYPASPESCNLAAIPRMRERFGCPVGLSDHTMGSAVAVAAVALGACAVEKHLTLSRADGGVDSSFSAEPGELRRLVAEVAEAALALGSGRLAPDEAERRTLKYRRSLYTVETVGAGERFTPGKVRSIRPASGLPPREWDRVMRSRAARRIEAGTPLAPGDLLSDEAAGGGGA
jgi:N-acetylneuraminate synthase